MDLNNRLKQLQTIWPEVRWVDACLIECDHDVVILDNALVFRFSSHKVTHEPLDREIRFLGSLRERADLLVPDYIYIDKLFRVAGYKLLPGEPLTLEKWTELTQEQIRGIAVGVAGVLDEVHRFPVDEAVALGLPKERNLVEGFGLIRHSYSQMVQRGDLSRAEKEYCHDALKQLTSFLSSSEGGPMKVIHADIEFDHILCHGTKFGGIIDFGDVAIGDPAFDFGFFWERGETFVDEVLESYPQASDDLKRRSRWWWFGMAIQAMAQAAEEENEGDWNRAYRLFPQDIAQPERRFGPWRPPKP